MKNDRLFNEALPEFVECLISGTPAPGIIAWGIKCDAYLRNKKDEVGEYFLIDQEVLTEVYDRLSRLTNTTPNTWKEHLEFGAKDNKVDIQSTPLYLQLIIYRK